MRTYLIVRTLTKKLSKILWSYEKRHPEIVAFNIKGQKKQLYSNAIKFYKDDGLVLTYLAGLMIKYPSDLDVFGAEKINLAHLPPLVRKGGDWLAEHKHNKFQLVAKNIGTTNEELKEFKLGAKVPVHSVMDEIKEERDKRRKREIKRFKSIFSLYFYG